MPEDRCFQGRPAIKGTAVCAPAGLLACRSSLRCLSSRKCRFFTRSAVAFGRHDEVGPLKLVRFPCTRTSVSPFRRVPHHKQGLSSSTHTKLVAIWPTNACSNACSVDAVACTTATNRRQGLAPEGGFCPVSPIVRRWQHAFGTISLLPRTL